MHSIMLFIIKNYKSAKLGVAEVFESIEWILQLPLTDLLSSVEARLRHRHFLFFATHDTSDIRKFIYLHMPSKNNLDRNRSIRYDSCFT